MLEWELAGVVACLRHRCLLIDACGHCGRRLNWARPSIDVCSCGFFLASSSPSAVTDAMINWTASLALKGCECGESIRMAARDFPRWLDPLSADAWTAVGFAFGVREGPFDRVTSAAATVPSSTERMAAILARAHARLQGAMQLLRPAPPDLRLCVYEQGVSRLLARNACQADRDTAAALLRWLGTSPSSAPSVRRHDSRQGELFTPLDCNE